MGDQKVSTDLLNGIQGKCYAARQGGRWVLVLELPGWIADDLQTELLETGVLEIGAVTSYSGMYGANSEAHVMLRQKLPLLDAV